jgi:histidine triad (HIT) family protein
MCTFCGLATDRLLVELDPMGAILVDRTPLCVGHLLVVPPPHIASIADLPEEARSRFLARVETARTLASAIAGRPAIALEHGRSPTCGDRTRSCHAHVHLVPVGLTDQTELEETGLLLPGATDEGPYLGIAIGQGDRQWHRYRLARPLPHAARTIASLVAQSNGVAWQPFWTRNAELAAETLSQARNHMARMSGTHTVHRTRPALRPGPRPIVTVAGPTGAGKTTVGAQLAAKLKVPAVELGVIVRLLCLSEVSPREKVLASMLWRWVRKGRLDFDGLSVHGLAAAVPRLDGQVNELAMWRELESDRLSALARAPDIEEALGEIARGIAKREGAVILGRVPPVIEDAYEFRLGATPAARAHRKRTQLARIKLGTGAHDWFDPHPTADHTQRTLDTTNLQPIEMCATAAHMLTEVEGPHRRTLAS